MIRMSVRASPKMVFDVTAALGERWNDCDEGQERAQGHSCCLRFHFVPPTAAAIASTTTVDHFVIKRFHILRLPAICTIKSS
jgi:hypothetical protein